MSKSETTGGRIRSDDYMRGYKAGYSAGTAHGRDNFSKQVVAEVAKLTREIATLKSAESELADELDRKILERQEQVARLEDQPHAE